MLRQLNVSISKNGSLLGVLGVNFIKWEGLDRPALVWLHMDEETS